MSVHYMVKKRNGSSEEFNVAKVKKVISWACEDLEVNELKLESRFHDFFFNGITTLDIHEQLIYQASSMASPEEPEWVKVAGRLETMKIWKENKFKENNFRDFFYYMLSNDLYANRLYDMYSKEDIDVFHNAIVPERDLEHSYGSVLTAKKKYLMKNETIQYMQMSNAMAIASIEPEANRRSFVLDVYEALSQRKISLATPWLSNLRNGGNISSCFIIGVNDSLESLTNNWKNAAQISKSGGGVGIDLSRIRAMGSMINGTPNASGGVSGWAKIFNDIAVSVDQGGKRAGAFTIHLPIWHRDIEDFIEIQSEVGDQRKKAHDIFPQVGVNDYFMEIQQRNDESWYTFCPYEVEKELGIRLYEVYGDDFKNAYLKAVQAYHDGILKNVGVYDINKDGHSPREALLKPILRTWFDSGLPYIAFLDTINRTNPNKHDGYIPCVNLCTESFSNVVPDQLGHTCNLASPVVGRLTTDEELMRITALNAHILDNGIELTKSPNEINDDHNHRYRTIGTGIQGLHDYLAYRNTNYQNTETIVKMTEMMAYACVERSIELAKKRGAYPAFKGSRWDTGEQISEYKQYSITDLDWDALQEKINKYGIRNSQLMSPAPNTSTSIFMDAAAGILPVYAGFFREDNSAGKFPVASMYLKEKPISYAKTFNMFDQSELANTFGAMQKLIDTGMSVEFILDLNLLDKPALEAYNIFNAAWSKGLKSIYYVRSVKKGQTIEDLMGFTDASCVACAG